ncbi:hypothetical protein IWQ60_003748 [Tieghemiomyces parasiticus]|uniref:Zn(2)-C6 fungal-type domain-containing protein n=1 Tax=Tieghemiomyces parasiticus TaxID=78921 RepID=A0A9W8AA79_9FUNG|nr:hypothetical protein IWQ60_003748 [Tieghemiomyces parasiticus]
MVEYHIQTFKLNISAPKPRPPPKKNLHRRRACDRCVARKTGCDGKEPCAKCQQAPQPVDCHYSSITRQPPRKRQHPDSDVGERSPPPHTAAASDSTATSASPSSSTSPWTALSNAPWAMSQSAGRSPTPTPITHPGGRGPMAIETLLTTDGPSPLLSPPVATATASVDWCPWTITDIPLPPSSTSASTDYSEATCLTLCSDPLALSSAATPLAVQLTGELERYRHLPPQLRSQEEILFAPGLVRSLAFLYVLREVRMYRRRFYDRLQRKLDRGEVSALALNCILCLGISVLPSRALPPRLRQELAMAYIDRVSEIVVRRLHEYDTPEVPFLLFRFARMHGIFANSQDLVTYVTLSSNLVITRRYHLLDLEDSQPPADPNQAFHYEMNREITRRSYHESTFVRGQIANLLGLPGMVSNHYVRVNPINDQFLERLFMLPPDEDTYPALIPGLGHSVCGYPPVMELADITTEVSLLRSRIQPADPSDVDLRPYLELNERLSALFPRLLADYPLGPPPHSNDPELDNPVYRSGISMVHSLFHSARLLLNVHNWTFGNQAFRPELHQALRAYGTESADHFTTHCLPYIRRVPTCCHNLVTNHCCFTVGFWYANELRLPDSCRETNQADVDDNADGTKPRESCLDRHQVRRRLDTIDMYVRYLDEFKPYVTYHRMYRDLILRTVHQARDERPELRLKDPAFLLPSSLVPAQ